MAKTVMNVDGTLVNLTPGMNVTVEIKTNNGMLSPVEFERQHKMNAEGV